MTRQGQWEHEVLDFWFTELTPEDWFGGGSEVDDAIRERFSPLIEDLLATAPLGHAASADEALAAIIVLDQFTRNVFRGTAKAFAGDDLAISIARAELEAGRDAGMTADRKKFLYMPFMHSEKLDDQERSVRLFSDLGDTDSIHYAIDHRDVVARFGRFPFRNAALGRESTPEEIEFMKGHKGYGQ